MFRYDIINLLIKKFNFERYLEIGVAKGETFEKIECKHKDAVDPNPQTSLVNYEMTSDDFFMHVAPNLPKYDIIFIDGDHHSEQVSKDLWNALTYTANDGVIVLHDCNPPTIFLAVDEFVPGTLWNGDVYRTILNFRVNNILHKYVTVNTDWGVGVVLKGKICDQHLSSFEYNQGYYVWDYFDRNRKRLLNLKTPIEFLNMLKNL